jgi:hypothetical protein
MFLPLRGRASLKLGLSGRGHTAACPGCPILPGPGPQTGSRGRGALVSAERFKPTRFRAALERSSQSWQLIGRNHVSYSDAAQRR